MSTPTEPLPTDIDPNDPDSSASPFPPPPTPTVNTGPPLQPEQPITWEPAMWYSATATCADTTCVNYNRLLDLPMLYSNDGVYVMVICGLCSHACTILAATLLDPQPPEE
ncbi:hypothetical protein ACFV3R_25420 [Streptomyces sp. NPDC059740]|uniref:hypothetical protein n=1 Tax=Streptomyces sp. NPDC059740 TaxID=3346926 RepID=UPI003661577A